MRNCAIVLPLLFFLAACDSRQPMKPDCDVNAGACVRSADGLTVKLDITPKPVRALRELTFSVLLDREGRPVERASVEVDLTMPGMDMGRNRIALAGHGGGRYAGKGVIVRCPSGQTVWKAAVEVRTKSYRATADYLIEVP